MGTPSPTPTPPVSSAALGTTPRSNWLGSMYGIGAGSHFDFLLKNGAGGKFAVKGAYLWRTFMSSQFSGGIGGLFRISAPGTVCQVQRPQPDSSVCGTDGSLCPTPEVPTADAP